MKIRTIALVSLFVSALSVGAWAIDNSSTLTDEELEIANVRVTEVDEATLDNDIINLDKINTANWATGGWYGGPFNPTPGVPGNPGNPGSPYPGYPGNPWSQPYDPRRVDFSQVINIGKQIWDVITSNQPVVNVKSDNASALPLGVNHWTNLEGWQMPMSSLYKVEYENIFGKTVIEFTYRVLFSWGGNIAGRGKYLAQVSVVPAMLRVNLPFEFNVKAEVPNTTNAGTLEDPIASVELNVNRQMRTKFKYEEATDSFYIRGDGKIVKLR